MTRVDDPMNQPYYFPVVVIGGGPAGLTAAQQLIQQKVQPVVLEKETRVGGLARTKVYFLYSSAVFGIALVEHFARRVVTRVWAKHFG